MCVGVCVCVPGGVYSGGVPRGRHPPNQQADTHLPSEQKESQTFVKILPWPKLRLRPVMKILHQLNIACELTGNE